MTDLERYTEPTTAITRPAAARAVDDLVNWAHAAKAAHELADALCRTDFVPGEYRDNPGGATAAILYGSEVGLSPIQSLQGIYVAKGRNPAMYARTMMAVVLAAGHEVWAETVTDRKVVVKGRRRGTDAIETAEWTIDRANVAGYNRNAKYKTEPQAMLLARAHAEICRRIAPDALLGMAYSVEELEDENPTAPAKATVQRRTRATAEPSELPALPEEPTRPKPAGGAQPHRAHGGQRPIEDTELPPLPGEQPVDNGPQRDVDIRPEQGVDEPPPRPGSYAATDAQMRKLHATFNEHGITDRNLRLAYCIDVLGREIASSKDLTKTEASDVIEALIRDGLRPPDDEPVDAELVDEPPLPLEEPGY